MDFDKLASQKWQPGDWTYINKLTWGNEELAQVYKTLELDWFGGQSQANKNFEKAICRFTGIKHFQTTNSGSAALEAAVQTFVQYGYWQPGDKILHPALTFPTSISAAIMAGMIPVYVDVDPGTYVISTEQMQKAFEDQPDIKGAIIPLLIGNVPNLDVLRSCLGDRKWIVDSCDTMGSLWDGREAGTYGDFFSYSFYGSHHISTFGVGGGFGTNDDELFDYAKSMVFWGRDFSVENKDQLTSFLRRYSYLTIGFDAQMSAVQAAFGMAQMERLAYYLGQRATLFRRLMLMFAKYNKTIILPERVSDRAEPSWFCFPLTLRKESKFTRENFVEYLLERKIEIRPVMTLLPDQPPYQQVKHQVLSMSNAVEVQNRGFFLPCCPMEDNQMEYYLKTVENFLSRYG